jgi:MPBQ/MSBQ methyltransferase
MTIDVSRGTQHDRLVAYYEEAGPDFAQWSAGFNMHFGYYRRGLNPFRRERMLSEMNRQVLDRLRLASGSGGRVVDLGCGVGATLREAAARFPSAEICGITVVPWQVEKGNAWNQRLGIHPRARLELRDYTDSGFPASSADGAYAIESACHAPGGDKEPFVREAARILKSGARLVVADGFRKNHTRPFGPVASRLHHTLCESFVLPELADIELFAAALTRHGFGDIHIEDASWRVAPSALHAPAAVVWFALKKSLRGERLGRWSISNLKGSALSAVVGALRWKFGYYIVSARRG